MADVFDRAFSEIIGIEGGYSDRVSDKGGKTKYGITEAVAREFGYSGPMADLPLVDARTIYKRKYWDAIKLGELIDDQLAIEVFDIAVNMGQGIAVKMLQKSLNYLNRNARDWPDLAVDGLIGPITLAIANNVPEKRKKGLYKAINGLQFMRYVHIIEYDPSQEEHFNGWLTRV